MIDQEGLLNPNITIETDFLEDCGAFVDTPSEFRGSNMYRCPSCPSQNQQGGFKVMRSKYSKMKISFTELCCSKFWLY